MTFNDLMTSNDLKLIKKTLFKKKKNLICLIYMNNKLINYTKKKHRYEFYTFTEKN